MTGFWRGWMVAWCLSVGAFGVVLTTGATEATDRLVRVLLGALSGTGSVEMTPALRFSLAVMGPVTIGWCLALLACVRAADLLRDRAAPVWRLVTCGVVAWYVIDSILSVSTGFGLNVIPNTPYLIAYFLPIMRTGALGGRRQRLAA